MKKIYQLGLLLFCSLSFNYFLQAQDFEELKKLVAADRQIGDQFAYSVSISGNLAIVGASREDHDETGTSSSDNISNAGYSSDAGAAYIFERDANGVWILIKKLVSSDRQPGDNFGFSVAISGDLAIVGAYLEDHDETGTSSSDFASEAGFASSAGSAYIFSRNEGGTDNWGEVKKLIASDRQTNDYFGFSVSISGDLAIVGAVFESHDETGTSNSDLVSEAGYAATAGSAYIFSRNEGGTDNWGEVKKLVASDRQTVDNFGSSVSISGDLAIVGAPKEDHDETGTSNSDNISEAAYAQEAGAAYIFLRNAGGTDNWGEVKKLVASDRQAVDEFGFSVSISGDLAIIGAKSESHDETGTSSSDDISEAGYTEEAGAAYIFSRNEGGTDNWGEIKKLVASDRQRDDLFGFSVSLSGDLAIIGAPNEDHDETGTSNSNSPFEDGFSNNAGSAYIFSRNEGGTDNWGELKKLVASDRQSSDNFGFSASISGGLAILGAWFESHDETGTSSSDLVSEAGYAPISGSAYIFGEEACTDCPPGCYVVTNTFDHGFGSLRQAILDANANSNANVNTPDTIKFNIGATAPHIIFPESAFPAITDAVVIDGLTQPGAHCSTWPPNLLIEIDGSQILTPFINGLVLDPGSDGSTIRGLAINSFTENGIKLNSSFNTIECNFLGTDITGEIAKGNTNDGLKFSVLADNNQIGGTEVSSRNLLSGNLKEGIDVQNGDENDASDNNIIQGNYIGVNVQGNAALPNEEVGVEIDDYANNWLFAGNLVSGNGFEAMIIDDDASEIYVYGNYFGTDASGVFAIPNASRLGSSTIIPALEIDDDVFDIYIGGPLVGQGNIISGNASYGMEINKDINNITVQGNRIGVNINGQALPNGSHGIRMAEGDIQDILIGGDSTGMGNIIAYNKGAGIFIANPQNDMVSGISILQNAIYNNAELGIDLDQTITDTGSELGDGNGVTANDTQDADTGPNELQNHPVLSTSNAANGSITITGSLNSEINSTYRIEFFANTACNGDDSGNAQTEDHGEGEVFLGFDTVRTNANGDVNFTTVLSAFVPDGAFITATATSELGSTSEFSQCIQNSTPPGCYVVINTNDSGFGSLRQAILDANANSNVDANTPDTIKFNIGGVTTHTIFPESLLPEITDPVVIDGLTQTGADCSSWPPNLLIEIDGSLIGGLSDHGIQLVEGSEGSTISGLVINSFSGIGIQISSSGHIIECNFLGTDVNGEMAKPNELEGICLFRNADRIRIGGPSVSQRNLISGNGSDGIEREEDDNINNDLSEDVTIQGNFIGVDVHGTSAIPNGSNGIQIDNLSTNYRIGGANPGEGNVISGNKSDGLNIQEEASEIYIYGNLIGTDASGVDAIPNGALQFSEFGTLVSGVLIERGASDIYVGGPLAGQGNIVSGNALFGMEISDLSSNVTVQGNRFGLNINDEALPNGSHGIRLADDGAQNVLIGGDSTGMGNAIAFNGGAGIFLADPDNDGLSEISVLRNSIYNNAELGIDLDQTLTNPLGEAGDGNGVNVNDFQDTDTGPNALQNYPVLSISNTANGIITITGSLNSAPNSAYRIEFFANTACNGDDSGNAQTEDHGEGEVFLGFDTVMTDANGDANFTSILASLAPDGAFITSTATSELGNTSEFSQCIQNSTPPGCYVVINTNDSGFGSLRQAILDANANSNADANTPDTIKFNIGGIAPHTIYPETVLPPITDAVVIDGLTQPGADCSAWPPTLLIEIDGSRLPDIELSGILLDAGSDGSTIRGLVINSFSLNGIRIFSSDNIIECNFVGTDVSGLSAKPNNGDGIRWAKTANRLRIGGPLVSQRNLVSGNNSDGLEGTDSNSSSGELSEDVTIQGNYIGVNVMGNAALPNRDDGIQIDCESSNYLIGGAAAGEGNVISGNYSQGLIIQDGAFNIKVYGNLIGTDASGQFAIPNGANPPEPNDTATPAVEIDDDANNIYFGGPLPGQGNIVAGNAQYGMEINKGVSNIVVQGNRIGVNINDEALSNGSHGIRLAGEAIQEVLIGGENPRTGNIIAYNNGAGIFIADIDNEVVSGISILQNAIFNNAALGIDLDRNTFDINNEFGDGNGVTPNDELDLDEGPNTLQNYPVISSAIYNGSSVVLGGTLNSTANSTYRIEFFANAVCNGDQNGLPQTEDYGEGEVFLGFVMITTDANGIADFGVEFSDLLNEETYFTATATNEEGSTSEFARCIQAINNCACRNTVNVGLNADCKFQLEVAHVLSSTDCAAQDFMIIVNDNDPTNGSIIDGPGTYDYGVFDGLKNLICHGTVIAEDKSEPVLIPPADKYLECWLLDDVLNNPGTVAPAGDGDGENSDPATFDGGDGDDDNDLGFPKVTDGCEGHTIPFTWSDAVVHYDCDSPYDTEDYRVTAVLTRRFSAADAQGNETTATQTIYFVGPRTTIDGDNNVTSADYWGWGPLVDPNDRDGDGVKFDYDAEAGRWVYTLQSCAAADEQVAELYPYYTGQLDCETGAFDQEVDIDPAPDNVVLGPDYRDAFGNKVRLDEVQCNLSVQTDNRQFSNVCSDGSYKQERHIRIFDWCESSSEGTAFPYLVKVGDFEAPVFNSCVLNPFNNPIENAPADYNFGDAEAAIGYLNDVGVTAYDVPSWVCLEMVSTGPMDCTASLNTDLSALRALWGRSIVTDCADPSITTEVYSYSEIYVGGFPTGEYAWQIGAYSMVGTMAVGIPEGLHALVISATDGCYNNAIGIIFFQVMDGTKPVMKCDDELRVTLVDGDPKLGIQGYALVSTQDVDEGSWDNCGPVTLEVRRVIDNAATQADWEAKNGRALIDEYDDDDADYNRGYTAWADFVEFFCGDLTDKVTVELRGSDDKKIFRRCIENCTGPESGKVYEYSTFRKTQAQQDEEGWEGVYTPNQSICWLDIDVENGTNYTVELELTDGQLACTDEFDYANHVRVDYFGLQCESPDIEVVVEPELDQCGIGRYKIYLKDNTDVESKNRPNVDGRAEYVYVVADHQYWIKFPKDARYDCGEDQEVSGVETSADLDVACDLLAISTLPDETFAATSDPDACYKIFRTYRVINWCEYDGQQEPVVVSRDWDRWNGFDYGTSSTSDDADPDSRREYNLNPRNPDGDDIPGNTDLYVIVQRDFDDDFVDRVYYDADNDPTANVGEVSTDQPRTGPNGSGNFDVETYWWQVTSGSRGITQVGNFQYFGATSPADEAYYEGTYRGMPVYWANDYNADNSDPNGSANASSDNDDDDQYYGSVGFWQYTQHIIVYDDTAPEVTVEAEQECSINGETCDADTSFDIVITDACSLEDITVKVYVNGEAASKVALNATDTAVIATVTGRRGLGNYKITGEVNDGCGNITPFAGEFDVVDCKAPAPICQNGMVVELMPTDAGSQQGDSTDPQASVGMASVWAKDLIASPVGDCSGQGPEEVLVGNDQYLPMITKYSINRLDSAVADSLTSLIVTCADEGQMVDVEIHAWDELGNHDFCRTSIIVQDNNGACNLSGATGNIAGVIETEQAAKLEGVEVQLSGAQSRMYMTGQLGDYGFNNLTEGHDFSVIPTKDDDHKNGISTFDLILIQKHILGIAPLESPYQLIAADANNSKSVSTLDLIQIRKLILNIDTELANNTSWRFVDADYTFPNDANPWQEAFPEIRNINNLEGEQIVNFIAVKVGDVNNSANVEARSKQGMFVINTKEQVMTRGNEYTIEFTADLAKIAGYQFTLDVKQAEIVDIIYGAASAEHFGVFPKQGIITTSFNGEAPTENANGILFSVVLRANADVKVSEAIGISSRYTASEAYADLNRQHDTNGQYNQLSVALNFDGQTETSGEFVLNQNTPNPFEGETVISFNLPQAAEATITLKDVAGRTIKVIEGDFTKGYNEVRVKSNELPATGVFFYTLTIGELTATKKMIISG